jgi:hypothetical protein
MGVHTMPSSNYAVGNITGGWDRANTNETT